jgi:hypothetical protein
MLEHRAAVQQQLVQQEADGLHRLNLDREKVLARLWEIANLSPEMTRGSITGQVKALSMIVAMQNFIPDRHAVSSEKNLPAPAAKPQIYASPWLARRQDTTIEPQPGPDPVQQEGVPACPGVPWKPAPPGSPASPVPACRGTLATISTLSPPALAPR